MRMRSCKRLYCNPGCAGFPFSKKTKGSRTPHLNKSDIDFYDNFGLYREGEGAGPTYWKAPIADFDDRLTVGTVLKLRRKGATTMCARESNTYGLTNPDWLNQRKLGELKAALKARATSLRPSHRNK